MKKRGNKLKVCFGYWNDHGRLFEVSEVEMSVDTLWLKSADVIQVCISAKKTFSGFAFSIFIEQFDKIWSKEDWFPPRTKYFEV